MSRQSSFRAVRWIRSLNLLAQAALLLSFFGGLNYLARHYSWRYDLTAQRRHSLSPETLSYLASLPTPVQVYIATGSEPDSPDLKEFLKTVHRDLHDLLQEYAHATENKADHPAGRISWKFLDVYQNRVEAGALNLEQPNAVLIQSGEGPAARRRLVSFDELYRVENKQVKAFLGEQVLTAAILDVANPTRKKIYFTASHNEMPIDGAGAYDAGHGLSKLADWLRARNFDLEALDLTVRREVPSDAALIVVAGPRARFSKAESELLRAYLRDQAGRLILMLEPVSPNTDLGLDSLISDDWGIRADNVLICDSNADEKTPTGDLILLPTKSGHPVVSALAESKMPVVWGRTRIVRADLTHEPDPGLVITTLLGTPSRTAFGKLHYETTDQTRPLPGDLQLRDGLTTAAAAERHRQSGLPFSVPSGRLLVFGGADWVGNSSLEAAGNLQCISDAINWMVNRALALGSVPARPVENLQLVLSEREMQRLRGGLLFALPGAAALLGLAVWWYRRR